MADPIVIITAEQLTALVRAAVRAELAANDASDPDEVLDVFGAAAEAKKSPRTIRRAARAGELGKKDSGGEWRFTRAEVRTWARPAGREKGDTGKRASETASRLLAKAAK